MENDFLAMKKFFPQLKSNFLSFSQPNMNFLAYEKIFFFQDNFDFVPDKISFFWQKDEA